MVEVSLAVVQLLQGFNGCSLLREAKIVTGPASRLPLPVPTKSGTEDGWKSKGKCTWCVISGRDLPASPTQLRVQSGCVDPRSDSAPVQRFPYNLLPSWQGLARKLFFPNPSHSYFWFLETHKARGPQDVQDADKINTGELSVSYHQLQFTSVLDFTEHKTKGPAPCLFSLKFSKITQTRMLHVKQETAERRYKKDERRWEQLWKELFVRLQFLVLPNSQMESLGIGASI